MSNYSYVRSNSDYNLIPEGNYEVYVEQANVGQTPNGADKVSIKFRVRSDVEQDCKNRVYFDTIWREKEEPTFFNRKKIGKILDACTGIPEKIEFEDIQDFVDLINGKEMMIHLAIVDDEYNGVTSQKNVVFWYNKTKFPPKELAKEENTPIAVKADDEDLPF